MEGKDADAELLALERVEAPEGIGGDEGELDALSVGDEADPDEDDLEDLDRVLGATHKSLADGAAAGGFHEASTVGPDWAATGAGNPRRSAVKGSRARQYNPAAEAAKDRQVESRPSTADDFMRNFMIKHGLHRSLDAFNSEWFELKLRGMLSPEDLEPVPDEHHRIQQLEEQLHRLRTELAQSQEVARKAEATWDKFRRERDYHRMHHKRVLQEKNKLIVDLKRLQRHYTAYEPTIAELKRKYEAAMKEKMLMRLERDRTSARAKALQEQVDALEAAAAAAAGLPPPSRAGKSSRGDRSGRGAAAAGGGGAGRRGTGRVAGDSKLPTEDEVNPFLSMVLDPVAPQTFQQLKSYEAHESAISAVACHPSKPAMATASDDATWKLWGVPDAELVMTGTGHQEWLADVAFHPRGTHLASSSGDGVIKLWSFVKASCSATLTEHTQAAWGIDFHHTGDFLVSCSMDQTVKLWDMGSLRCRQTMRGHTDSVNSVCFQPFAAHLATGSGDKTVSIWDVRSGLSVQTFFDHNNAVNSVEFTKRGDSIVACDADGIVRVFDVRMVKERFNLDTGNSAANDVAVDQSGTIVAVASDDSGVHVIDLAAGVEAGVLRGHGDTVQAVCFDHESKTLVSAGSDNTVKLWSCDVQSAQEGQ